MRRRCLRCPIRWRRAAPRGRLSCSPAARSCSRASGARCPAARVLPAILLQQDALLQFAQFAAHQALVAARQMGVGKCRIGGLDVREILLRMQNLLRGDRRVGERLRRSPAADRAPARRAGKPCPWYRETPASGAGRAAPCRRPGIRPRSASLVAASCWPPDAWASPAESRPRSAAPGIPTSARWPGLPSRPAARWIRRRSCGPAG